MSLPTSSAIADAIAETLRLDSAAPSPTFSTNSEDENENSDAGNDDQSDSDTQSLPVDDDDNDDSDSDAESVSDIDSDALRVSLSPDSDAQSLNNSAEVNKDKSKDKSVNAKPNIVEEDEQKSKRLDLMARLTSQQSVFFVPNIESDDVAEEITRVPVGLFYISQNHKPQKSRKLFQTTQQQPPQRFVSIQPSWSSSSKLHKSASLPATRRPSFGHVHPHLPTDIQPPLPNEDNPLQSLLRTVLLKRTTKRSLGFTITFKDPHPNADDQGGPVQQGAVITAVDPTILTSDLRVGDIILEVDGVAVPGIAAAQVIIMLDKDNLNLLVRSQPSSVPALRPIHQSILEEGRVIHDVNEENELEEFTMTFNRGPKRNPLGFEISISHATNKLHVSRISPGRSQAKMFLVGDQIVSINGIALSSIPELSMSWVRGLVDRDVVEMKVLRGGPDPNACVIS